MCKRNIDVQEKHWSAASSTPPTGDVAPNPGMCPDWESNLWSFGSQANTQSTESHQPGCHLYFFFLLEDIF